MSDTNTIERPDTDTTAPEAEKPAVPNPTQGEVAAAISGAAAAREDMEQATSPQRFAYYIEPLITAAQEGWFATREARWTALYTYGVPLVQRAMASPKEWESYRKDKGVKGRIIVAQVFNMITATDPDSVGISSTRREVWSNMLGYLSSRACKGLSAEEAIAKVKGLKAKGLSGMDAAAAAYKASNPSLFSSGSQGGNRPGRRRLARVNARIGTLTDDGRLVAFQEDGKRFAVSCDVAVSGNANEYFTVGPIDSLEEAQNVLEGVNDKTKALAESWLKERRYTTERVPDTSKTPWHPLTPAAAPQQPDVRTREPGSPEPAMPEVQHVETVRADPAADPVTKARQACRDAFEAFMAHDPDEGDCDQVMRYLIGFIESRWEAETATGTA